MSLSTRINEIRKSKKMSVDDLCALSGIPKGTLSKITAGITTNPNIETVKAISHALGCTLDDLDDDPAPETKKSPSLEDGDEEMLALYHQLNRDGQLVAQGEIRCLLREDKYRKEAPSQAV